MNRAVLIVICDFLVSSMLAMLTSMVPANFGSSAGQGGGGAIGSPGVGLDAPTTALILNELRIREAQLEELRRRLHETRRTQGFDEKREEEIRKLTDELAATRIKVKQLELIAANNQKTIGKLTPAELKKRLDEAEIKNQMLELRIEDNKQLNQDLRKELSENIETVRRARESTAVTAARLARANEDLSRTREILSVNEQELQDREQRLEDSARKLEEANRETAVQKQTIDSLQNALAAALKQSERVGKEKSQLESNMAFVRGRLSTAEKNLAEVKDENTKNRKLNTQQALELQRYTERLAATEAVLKRAVKDRTETRSELDACREELERTKKELAEIKLKEVAARTKVESVEEQVAITTKILNDKGFNVKTRADVLSSYGEAAALLRINVLEKRLIVDQSSQSLFCIPLVELAGKTVMISNFNNLTGNSAAPLNFRDILNLSYRAAAPGGKDAVTVTTPLLVGKNDPRVAAVEVKIEGRTPLKTIFADALRKRGVENLYLFKANSGGKESASLGDRCSLDFASGEDVLYIRNGRSATELKAVPGDLILTKEGEFAGVVVAAESPVFNRREDARCMLFRSDFAWDKMTVSVPVIKRPGEKFFGEFAQRMRALHEKVQELELRDR